MTDRSLTLSAPAKINLYLGVHTERDDRGYHRVDSLMAAVGLSDTVTVTPAQALTVQTVPASDFPMQKNTAYRVAVAMAEHYGREANICVTIEKRIPLCAGLGGPVGCSYRVRRHPYAVSVEVIGQDLNGYAAGSGGRVIQGYAGGCVV